MNHLLKLTQSHCLNKSCIATQTHLEGLYVLQLVAELKRLRRLGERIEAQPLSLLG